jgi:hypothetical protein
MYFNLFLALFFLLGTVAQTGMTTVLLKMGYVRGKEELKKHSHLFFFAYFLKPFFGKHGWEGLFFTLSFSKHILHLCYGILALFILLTQDPFTQVLKTLQEGPPSLDPAWMVGIGALIIFLSLFLEMSIKFLGTIAPHALFRLTAPLSSFFLLFFAPLTATPDRQNPGHS